ncbi:hypothetical protein F5884DRAFT_698017 [Xylogone sp. PMI_703]|nr:hypothetical protein F5884DRAFT_698017 [Xylogone sp. PMI_703]
MKNSALVSVLATCAGVATATFNLNTSGPDWDYTASDLANTTSQACKDAYSADIDCDITLLGLVASMRPGFKPSSSDLDNTCTSTCQDSLAAYVKGVQAACTEPGDKAQESVGGGDNTDFYLDPVEIVGQLFQYTFASDCRKADNGSYCYFTDVNPNADFDCSDKCAMEFYQAAHDYPASAKQFNYYFLISRGSWWADQFVEGWKTVEACNGDVDSSSSDTTSTKGSKETGTKTVTALPASQTSTGTVMSSAQPTTSTPSASSTPAASPPATNTTSAPTGSFTPSSSSTVSSSLYATVFISCILGLVALI